MLLVDAGMPLSGHGQPLSMIGLTSCLNIAMLLMGIDIMSVRPRHATDERLHATFRTWSSSVHDRINIMSEHRDAAKYRYKKRVKEREKNKKSKREREKKRVKERESERER